MRHPSPTINSTINGSSGNQLAGWSFSTFGDQFHIEITFKYLVNLTSLNFTGELQFDTDRSLTTGLFHNPWVVGGPLKEEIPTWGWDVAIVFGGGGSQTGSYDTPISLDFGKQSTLISPPHNYAYPYGFAFGESYNDGRWFVSENKLVLEGSLNMLDARKWSSDTSGGNRQISVVGSNGNVVGRLFANNIFTASIADMIPKSGYAFDVASNSLVPSIQWSPAATSINLPYGGVTDPEAHYDISRIDAQIKDGNLTVKGTVQRLDTTWYETDFVLLLDTDMNSGTGTKVNDIGVDYTVFVENIDMYTYSGYTTTLVKPGSIKEGHDSWLNIDYSNSSQVNSPADITLTVPLQSIGNPNNVRLYLATVTSGAGASLQDVAPTRPITLSSNTNYPLTVTISGQGTVTSNPAGINCGTNCSNGYVSGAVVALTAAAAPGFIFAGWSGDADCADGQVTMSAAKVCTATFNLTSTVFYTLTVALGGTGSGVVTSSPVGINCRSDCLEGYARGTVVTLTATSANGSIFTGWGGACSSTGTCQVTLSEATSVTANFVANQMPDANAECLFNWAERNYPSLFAPSGTLSAVSPTDTYRYYSQTNAYLRFSSIYNHVYYQGSDGKLQDVGSLSDWLPKAACQFSPPPTTW